MRTNMILGSAVVLTVALATFSVGRAQQPTVQLDRLVQQLQNNPSNQALRKEIIQLANSMNPKPSVPGQFYKLMGEARFDFQHAQDKRGYVRAAKEFADASLQAPWVADVYFDLGQAQEKADQYGDAVGSFRLYLLAAPDAKDRNDVQKRILEDQGAAEADARVSAATSVPSAGQPSPRNQTAQQPETDADFIRSLNGARYVERLACGSFKAVVIDGEEARFREHLFNGRPGCTHFRNWMDETWAYPIRGRTIKPPSRGQFRPSQCVRVFGNPDCHVAYTIHRRYVEMDWYVGGEKATESQVEEIRQKYNSDYSPQIYDRQQ